MFSKEELLTILFCVRFMALTPDTPGNDKLQKLYEKIENMILDRKEEKEMKA